MAVVARRWLPTTSVRPEVVIGDGSGGEQESREWERMGERQERSEYGRESRACWFIVEDGSLAVDFTTGSSDVKPQNQNAMFQ